MPRPRGDLQSSAHVRSSRSRTPALNTREKEERADAVSNPTSVQHPPTVSNLSSSGFASHSSSCSDLAVEVSESVNPLLRYVVPKMRA